MSNKTISINPSLFSLGGSKTKKAREKIPKQAKIPIISPNILKNKLLKRIKEHKQRETEGLENNKRKLNSSDNEIKINNEAIDFNDEFASSINYLQTLSKQKKINDEKKNYELLKQKKREELERKTLRNHNNEYIQQNINIDLPDELNQPIINNNITQEPITLNIPYKGDPVPYGVLKGGLKPSYREWSKTQRNNIVTNPTSSLIIENSGLNTEKTLRENRLNILKEKLRLKNAQESNNVMLTENLIKPPNSSTSLNVNQNQNQILQQNSQQVPIINNQQITQPNIENDENIIARKNITKKTIKKKYTLGRSQIKKTVGVLIKDRSTRKNVLNAQKELKRRNINDVKLYLREHNLIKIGSNAPNDVLRKIYESAMLAGEITNDNTETLMHNLIKSDKEL